MKTKLNIQDIPGLLFAILVTNVIGISSALLAGPSSSDWFVLLEKPFLNPPSWIFGPVWTLLYSMMGIAAYLIWQQRRSKKYRNNVNRALAFFSVQLMLNFFWTLIFFGLHNLTFAFVEIVILWIMIYVTIVSFCKISKPAAWLMIPYFLWVSFAAYLNLAFAMLN